MSFLATAVLVMSVFFTGNTEPLKDLSAAASNAVKPCTAGYIFHDGVCKPQVMDLTAETNWKYYLGDTLTSFRAWRDWRSYQPMVKRVEQLTVNKKDSLEKAKAILNWAHASKNYGCPDLANNLSAPCDNSPANNNADFPIIYNSDIGVCLDAAIITTAMLRTAGIPSLPVMVSANHIVTLFYANGKWYMADTTFLVNKKNAQPIRLLSSEETHSRFFEIVTGEINQDMGINGMYCDIQFCMKTPFRSNRQLMNKGVQSGKITFPAMTIASYDSTKQILCSLRRKGVMNDAHGSTLNIYPEGVNEWDYAGVSYFIGNSDPVGYITSLVPVGITASVEPQTPIIYRFECRRGYVGWEANNQKLLAYKDVAIKPGEAAVITYKDLVKDPSATNAEFRKTVNLVKSTTESLGISPNIPSAKSLKNPLLRK